MRSATLGDAALYLEWANDPDVRRNSFTSCAISAEEHQAWFARKIHSADVLMLVLEIDAQPVGQIRFDVEGDTATISFALAPDARGRGLGAYLLRDGVRRLHQKYPGVAIVRGHVKADNIASRRAFEATGFGLSPAPAAADNSLVYDFDVVGPSHAPTGTH